MYSNIVPLLYWYIREQELTCSSRVWYHPDLLLQPTVRHPVFNQPVSGSSDTLLVLASWSLIWKHCRAAERHWKADQSHIAAELDLTSSTCGGLGFDVTLQDGRLLGVCRKPRRAPYASVCISMCLHSVKCAQRTWKHTWKNGVKKREKKISTHVTEEPKITHLVVSQSHSPFFIFSFSIVVACRPVTQPLKTSLSDCQLSWKLLRSVFSLLLLLQCIVGSAVRYSEHSLSGQTLRGLQQNQRTNQLLLYIVCVNARWEPSHAARRRKTSKSPLYCSVPNVCMYVCGGLYACI